MLTWALRGKICKLKNLCKIEKRISTHIFYSWFANINYIANIYKEIKICLFWVDFLSCYPIVETMCVQVYFGFRQERAWQRTAMENLVPFREAKWVRLRDNDVVRVHFNCLILPHHRPDMSVDKILYAGFILEKHWLVPNWVHNAAEILPQDILFYSPIKYYSGWKKRKKNTEKNSLSENVQDLDLNWNPWGTVSLLPSAMRKWRRAETCWF